MNAKQESRSSQVFGNILLTAIMLGLMIWVYQLHISHQDLIIDHKQDVEEMTIKLEQCAEKQYVYKERLLLLSHPSTKKVLLKGTDNSPESYVTLMFNPDLEKVIIDANALEEVKEGMSYQLWGRVGKDYIDMGVLSTQYDLEIIDQFVSGVSAFIITLQIEGGDEYADMDYIYVQGRV